MRINILSGVICKSLCKLRCLRRATSTHHKICNQAVAIAPNLVYDDTL
ncbi:hypothetical protein [Nostoc sp. DSM 114159]